MKPFFATLLFFFVPILNSASVAHSCTHGQFLLPMKPGMVPTADAVPVSIRHQNSNGRYTVQIYKKGDKCSWNDRNNPGGYTFEHNAYIIQRIGDMPYYKGIICGINETGSGEATQNARGNMGPDDKLVRLKAVTMGSDFDEMADLIRSESYENSTFVFGRKGGKWALGYQIQGKMTIHTPDHPWYLVGADDGSGQDNVEDESFWKRGDPNLFEVRDLVYAWHRFNSDSDFTVLFLPHLRLMWTTVDETSEGPMIPFSLDDFYVHPKIADASYAKSLELNGYSRSEIDKIEDKIMGPDGSYIGSCSIREIQKKIVYRLPID